MNAKKIIPYLISIFFLIISLVVINASLKKVHNAESSMVEFINDFTEKFAGAVDIIDSLKQDIDDKDSRLADFAVGSAQKDRLIEDLRSTIQELNESLSLAKEQINSLSEALLEEQDIHSQTRSERTQLKALLEEKESELMKLKSELEALSLIKHDQGATIQESNSRILVNNSKDLNPSEIALNTTARIITIELLNSKNKPIEKVNKNNWHKTSFTLDLKSSNLGKIEGEFFGVQLINTTESTLLPPREGSGNRIGSQFLIVQCINSQLKGSYVNWQEKTKNDTYQLKIFFLPNKEKTEDFAIHIMNPDIIIDGFLSDDYIAW